MVFKAVPAGTYYLVIEYELGKDNVSAVVDTLEVIRDPVGWSNYVLLLIFLVIFPLWSRWRRRPSRHGAGTKATSVARQTRC
jgi:hypothetical protein